MKKLTSKLLFVIFCLLLTTTACKKDVSVVNESPKVIQMKFLTSDSRQILIDVEVISKKPFLLILYSYFSYFQCID